MKRKAQNEIVGFVMIVVIVVLIGLFLLAFYLRQEPIETKSKNVQNFLKASMSYTTECVRGIEPLDLKELIKECYDQEYCGETKSCDLLNETFSDILEQTWRINSNQTVNHYYLDMYYREGEGDDLRNEAMFSIKEGNCTGSRTGAEEFFRHGNGDIFVVLKICYI